MIVYPLKHRVDLVNADGAVVETVTTTPVEVPKRGRKGRKAPEPEPTPADPGPMPEPQFPADDANAVL